MRLFVRDREIRRLQAGARAARESATRAEESAMTAWAKADAKILETAQLASDLKLIRCTASTRREAGMVDFSFTLTDELIEQCYRFGTGRGNGLVEMLAVRLDYIYAKDIRYANMPSITDSGRLPA